MKNILKHIFKPSKKQTAPQPKITKGSSYMPMPHTQIKRPVITATVVLQNGESIEMPASKSINNNNCLICNCSEYYHTIVGCYLKWNTNDRTKFDCWHLTTIATAKKQGYLSCLMCEEEKRNAERL